MRMVRWMGNVKVKDRVPSKELRDRLGIGDVILALQQNRLQQYGHVLQKENKSSAIAEMGDRLATIDMG